MAKQGFAQNTYNNKRLGDVSQYSFIIVASSVAASLIDPTTAPPDTTVSSDGSAHYTITIPIAVAIVLSGLTPVSNAKTISAVTVTPSTGVITFTLSGADLTGAETIHVDLYSVAP